MDKFLYLLCRFFAGLTLLGLISCDKPPEKIHERTSDNKIVEEKPPFETTATEIAKEYEDDVVAADNKFKDARFNVSGIIADIGKNFIQERKLSLKGGIDSVREPQFVFIESERDKGEELRVGQNIKLQCIGLGDIKKIPMSGECIIVE